MSALIALEDVGVDVDMQCLERARLCPYVGSSGDIVVKTAVTRCIVSGLASDVKVQIVVSREDKESAYSGQIGNSTSANPLGRLAKTNSRG